MYILDVAAYNSHVLFKIENANLFEKNNSVKRRVYLEKLSLDLMKPHVNSRYSNKLKYSPQSIDADYIEALKKFGMENNKSLENMKYEWWSDKPYRCRHEECKGNNNKHKFICKICQMNYCKTHCRVEVIVIIVKLLRNN